MSLSMLPTPFYLIWVEFDQCRPSFQRLFVYYCYLDWPGLCQISGWFLLY